MPWILLAGICHDPFTLGYMKISTPGLITPS
jgi:hypothetical protein